MCGCVSWILEVAPGERSWFNPYAACKGGIRIFIAHKYVKLISTHGALYDDRLVWIKLEGTEGENIGLAYVYASSILTERRNMWLVMIDSLPKNKLREILT